MSDELTKIDTEKNLPEKLPGKGMCGPVEHHVTAPEARRRRMIMDKLITTGKSNLEIEIAMEKSYDMPPHKSRKLMVECMKRLVSEGKERKPYLRDMARRRIYSYLPGAKEDHRWGDLANLEKILAEIEGTKVEEDEKASPAEQRVKDCILQVLNESDPAEVMAIIEKERIHTSGGDIRERERTTCLVKRK